MRKLAVAIVVSIILFAARSGAQQACPCVPIAYEWIVTASDSWNCAASAVVLAHGTNVVPMPTASSDYTWIVLRRIPVGSAAVSPNAPFRVDGFDSLGDASSRFQATDYDLQPMLLSAPDGKVLVVTRT